MEPITNSVERDLKTKIPNITVVDHENALRDFYIKIIVIDLSGKNSAQSFSDCTGAQLRSGVSLSRRE